MRESQSYCFYLCGTGCYFIYLCLHILIYEMGILIVYPVEFWENLIDLVHEKNLEHCLFRQADASVLMKCYDLGLGQSQKLA